MVAGQELPSEYSEPFMAREEGILEKLTVAADAETDAALHVRLLPRVSRTFAINIRVLGARMRRPVRLAYLLCRVADTLEDAWPGSPGEVGERFDLLRAALAGDRPAALRLAGGASGSAAPAAEVELIEALPSLLRTLAGLPSGHATCVRDCVETMALGMRHYAMRAAERPPATPYLDDTAELHDYCHVVAGCVGEMLTRLHAAVHEMPVDAAFEQRIGLAPRVGEALQLTNILLDWPSDLARGRCHLPASWLATHAIGPEELLTTGQMVARELALRLGGLADAALDEVADYLDLIPAAHVRYRLFVLWPALWARASLRVALADPRFPAGGSRPRLSRQSLWTSAVGSLLVASSHRGVRRLLAAPVR